MHIAILGATSQIAKDLILTCSEKNNYHLTLFARNSELVEKWLIDYDLSNRYVVANFTEFDDKTYFDAILNFVGIGDPAKIGVVGASIFDITLQYDQIALDYIKKRPSCRYIFLSSGAAYGSNFEYPVDKDSKAQVSINNLQPHDWYSVAKLHAECRHRSLSSLSIVDIRVFNYFSHTQDTTARFLITDIVRAIRDKTVLKTSIDEIVRDFIHPSDFYNLIIAILNSSVQNIALDCYSKAPITKSNLLMIMKENFGLMYNTEKSHNKQIINTTGIKPYYYSLNRSAAELGYTPFLTSIEGILIESKKILQTIKA
jgi:nucleoside-diphosphate-sugar epimerase